MPDPATLDCMRADWNRRAQEDAHYYVAFGRHNQDEEEFFSTAYEVVYGLEYELKRLSTAAGPRARRALEIGCGPGRLMKPLSRNFGEIHGVDVADEMIRMAREKLRGVPHAHVHHTEGSRLEQFAAESFDFVYSYAVFQHIPSREVVFSYLEEARRTLKTGGLLWFQVNGLPAPPDAAPNTWSGVRFRPEELIEFAGAHDFQIYTLEGIDTQYMWTSWRKRPDGWAGALERRPPGSNARIRRISNPHGTEPVVPCRGRFACASLWVESLPEELGLNHLEVRFGGAAGAPNYIGAPLADGQQQVNVLLPPSVPTGLVAVEARWLGQPLCAPAVMRVVPPGPVVPRIISITDATDLMAGTRILTRAVKVSFEELERPEELVLLLDGKKIEDAQIVCSDPRPPRIEVIFRLGDEVAAGPHVLEMRHQRRRFPAALLEVVDSAVASPH